MATPAQFPVSQKSVNRCISLIVTKIGHASTKKVIVNKFIRFITFIFCNNKTINIK